MFIWSFADLPLELYLYKGIWMILDQLEDLLRLKYVRFFSLFRIEKSYVHRGI